MNHTQLKEAVKQAMKDRDERRLLTMRGLLAAVTNELVATGHKPTEEMDEDGITALVRRGIKQRKDSIDQFQKGGRQDLVEKESQELAILEALLPAQMPREEIEVAARAKIAQLGVVDKSKSGQVVGMLMKDLKGKADGAIVKQVVESLL
ncbi:MAG TPA: GatB/YqeY domain-containing protein [Candidatus Paceibacterota bacterium]